MNDKRKAVRRNGISASKRCTGRSAHSLRIAGSSSKQRARLFVTSQGKKIFIGPSIGGKPMKLVEVTSGEVVDRKPSFV